MEYHGKLYCKMGKKYVELKETSDDFDNLKAENKKIKEWISVGDRMPDYNEAVLCFNANDKESPIYILELYENSNMVTHWKELPDKPDCS